LYCKYTDIFSDLQVQVPIGITTSPHPPSEGNRQLNKASKYIGEKSGIQEQLILVNVSCNKQIYRLYVIVRQQGLGRY